LSAKEIHRQFATLVLAPLTCVDQSFAGHTGVDDGNRHYQPAPATTAAAVTPADMNRAPLQYQASRKQQLRLGSVAGRLHRAGPGGGA
jgi:hypothetical protein